MLIISFRKAGSEKYSKIDMTSKRSLSVRKWVYKVKAV